MLQMDGAHFFFFIHIAQRLKNKSHYVCKVWTLIRIWLVIILVSFE